MSALTKRRRHSHYFILPVVVTVAFLIVAKLLALQRAEVVADLADRVAHRDTADASAALRQLAGMSRPPIEILVAAATSGDRHVADEARQAIDKLLRRCRRDVEAGRRLKTASRQLAELAKTLASHAEHFSAADHNWLTTTSQSILSLANQIPAQHSPEVAIHCDRVLAIVAAESPHDAKLAKQASEAYEPDPPVTTAPAVESPTNEPADASWRADWANPVFRTLPSGPIEAAPAERHSIAPVTPAPDEQHQPRHLETTESPMAVVDSRTLLEGWLSANAANKTSLELQLAKRGFKRLSEPFVRQFTSTSVEDRLQFVDDLLSTSDVDARPWLMLLADDPDADVRLAAVTIMATSNDAALVEKAWQAAIHDRDPRVAGLAERLRERRATTRRR